MKIYLKSYKNSKTIFASGIRLKQKWINGLDNRYSRLSHSEIKFGYTDNKEVLKRFKRLEIHNINLNKSLEDNFKENGLWFSSSEVDGGTRFKFIEDNKDNWVSNEFEVSEEEYLKALDYCIKQEGKAYNTLGIIGDQMLGIKWLRKLYFGKKFCSQISCEVLQILGYFVLVDGIDVTPGELAKLADNF